MLEKNKLKIDEIRKISLEILIDIDRFCQANNILYFLACGTLLGSIKYGGFIPWDDDIDIMMPRPEYERFINSYSNNKFSILKPKSGMYFYTKVYDNSTLEYERGMDYKKYNPIGINVTICLLPIILGIILLIALKGFFL